MSIRIVSANIQNGVGVTRSYGQYALVGWRYLLPHGPKALEELVRFVGGEAIDVLALSEVEGGSFRSRGIDYAQWLAERTPLCHHLFFPTVRRSLGGKVMANQGNAVLSRWPLASHEAHRLPGGGEPRYLCEATIEHPDASFLLFTTHLSLARQERSEQLLDIARTVGAKTGPRLLMGDLNTSDVGELRDVEDEGLVKLPTGPTYPSWAPRRCLDHVFASEDWNDASAVVAETVKVADHLPVVITVSRLRVPLLI